MNKILVSILLLSISLFGDTVDNLIKKECQYIVYGNGASDRSISSFMYGVVAGTLYHTEEKDSTKNASGTYADISELGCKEALSNNKVDSFQMKFLWGVNVIVNKNFTKYSNLK